jgi:hypothetical protein
MANGPCPACGFDGARLGPQDAAAALRSFPHRYRTVLKPADDDERPDDVLHRRPRRAGGLSAIEHAAWAATGIGEAGEALRLVLIQDRPVVSVPPVDPPGEVPGADLSAGEILARLGLATEPLAQLADRTHGDEWKRSGLTSDGSTITALELLVVAVHFGAHHLREADRTLNEVAGELPG